MSFVLRPAVPGDEGDIHRLIAELAVYEGRPATVVQATPASLRAQLEQREPPFACLLAEAASDGDDAGGRAKVIGMALYFRNYSTWTGQCGYYLEDLYVEPAWRGKGVGHALLARVSREVVARGATRLDWLVLHDNRPAIDFYRRIGAQAYDDWRLCRLSGDALLRLAGEASGGTPPAASGR